MTAYNNIMLAVPYRKPNQHTVQLALSFAKDHGAKLTLFGVTEEIEKGYESFLTTKPKDELLASMQLKQKSALQALVDSLKPEYDNVDCDVAVGIPFAEIVKRIQRDRFDLLILDAEDKHNTEKRFLGSTTKHVLRKCPCPVLTVRDKALPKTVMAAVDLYAPGEYGETLNIKVLKRAKAMAERYQAALHVVYALQPVGEPMLSSWGIGDDDTLRSAHDELKEESLKKLQKLVQDYAEGAPIEAVVLDGHPRDAIPEYVADQNIDLIVMGTVCRTGIKGFLIGNTAESIMEGVRCSILALKPQGFVSPISPGKK